MFKKNKNIWVRYLLFSIIVILSVIILFLLYEIINKNSYNIILNGDKEVIIYQGDTYIESGYFVYDRDNNLIEKDVKIENNIDTNKPGTYKIKYYIKEFLKNSKTYRTVIVKENPFINTNFKLIGLIAGACAAVLRFGHS